MKVIALYAHKNGVIGYKDYLPWICKSDMKHFRQLTDGEVVIVGGNTARSLPPLPNRTMIAVTSSDKAIDRADYTVKSPSDAIMLAEKLSKTGRCFVIGGAGLLDSMVDYIDGIICSIIEVDFHSDVDLDSDDVVRIGERFSDWCYDCVFSDKFTNGGGVENMPKHIDMIDFKLYATGVVGRMTQEEIEAVVNKTAF